jgi:hypothetical protein
MAFDRDEIIKLTCQLFGSTLSIIGSIIVSMYFIRKAKNYKKKHSEHSIVHLTMINLIICSGLLGVFNAWYHIYRVTIHNNIMGGLKKGESLVLKQVLGRLLYIFRISTQFFIVCCCCWTVNVAVALFYALSDRKQTNPISTWKILLGFCVFGYILPFIDIVFWGGVVQISITSEGRRNLSNYTIRIFECIYYYSHGLFLLFGFLANCVLLCIIWISIRRTFKNVEHFRYQSQKSAKKDEAWIAFSLSFYIIPFLICAVWQTIGYLILGIYYSTLDDTVYDAFIAITYPYSFFFPLQGFANSIVFSLNKKWARNFLYKTFCCICIKLREKEQREESPPFENPLLLSGRYSEQSFITNSSELK